MKIDATAYIAPGAVVLGDVTLREDSSIWYHTVVRGDSESIVVGHSTNIQDLSMLHADAGVPCVVGARVGVGHRAILHGCTVEDECLIGMGAILMNGVRVGSGSVVAAGAVIPEGVTIPPGSVVMGVPARVVREVDPVLTGRIASTWRHYVDEARRHRDGTYPRRFGDENRANVSRP